MFGIRVKQKSRPDSQSETAKKRWEVVQMMILHRLFSIPAQIAFPQSQPLKIAKPQSRQTNFHIFSKRKRGTSLSSQKDRCRRNGLNTGFSSPLPICSC